MIYDFKLTILNLKTDDELLLYFYTGDFRLQKSLKNKHPQKTTNAFSADVIFKNLII